jgi:hypothetical protein
MCLAYANCASRQAAAGTLTVTGSVTVDAACGCVMMQSMRQLALASLVPLLFAMSCMDEHHDGNADAAPSAPTGLAVSNVAGGAHLTWMDTSDNEDHFMIMRKEGTGMFDDVDMVTFNTTQFHDSSVTPGTSYVYKVVAMNAKGEASSNEVTFAP